MHEEERKVGRVFFFFSYFFFVFFSESFWVWFLVLHCSSSFSTTSFAVSPDGAALLEFKSAVGKDPLGFLETWSEKDDDPCGWKGVLCDDSRRVVALNITGRSSCRKLISKTSSRPPAASAAFLGLADEQWRVSAGSSAESSVLSGCSAEGLRPSDGVLVRPADPGSSSAFCLQNGRSANSSADCVISGKLSPAVGKLSQLRILSLPNNGFSGDIPKEIASLEFLEVLELQGNGFTGHVWPEFGKLKLLRVLDLGYNLLSGAIPADLAQCRRLETLNLARNALNGSIPDALRFLPGLRYFSLAFNHITGEISAGLFENCRDLEYFHLPGNLLTGIIPPQLGNCSRLRSVLLFSNFLKGAIPPEVGKLSMLETLDLSRNSLSQEIPEELGNCKKLSVLVLTDLLESTYGDDNTDVDPSTGLSNSEKGEFSYFGGTFPASVVLLPNIKVIWSPRATLSGTLPEDWGECNSLEVLNLGQNEFTGEIPSRLGNCRNLVFLDLSSNQLKGTVPDLQIPCILVFNVSRNFLSGNIRVPLNYSCPSQSRYSKNTYLDSSNKLAASAAIYSSFFLCSSWESNLLSFLLSEGFTVLHDFSHNNFTGVPPSFILADAVLEERPSYGLFLNGNNFSGEIPVSLFASCAKLQGFGLNISSNLLSSTVLAASCSSLKFLDASSNRMKGPISPSLSNMSALEYVDLSRNYLEGSIPPQLQQFKGLKFLSLARNKLTGPIMECLGQITSLRQLDLSSNSLTGRIPESLANLKKLKVLCLQQNRISGSIPAGFAALTSLVTFNVSFNRLSGQIPKFRNTMGCDNFKGNNFDPPCRSATSPSQQPELRGPLPFASPPAMASTGRDDHFNSLEIAAVSSASAVTFVVIVFVIILLYARRFISKTHGSISGRKEVVTFTNIGFPLTYENVVRATGSFSVGNLIGTGGFGATYKAELTPGLLVAVKRLSIGKFQGIQQFDAEIRTLGRIRHPNLVTLIGYHASETEMFLIYNYLSGGNLESFIHEKSARNADWKILHNIALDIAKALAYLHDECVPRVLHRDIKPSNILLDNDLKAYLSDFGLARLLGASETHVTTDVAGTFGYLAPEYAMTCRVSEKSDVYSYGVVLLELLSGKKALDPSFSSYGNGFNIVGWACMLLQEKRAREFYTKGLWDAGPHDALIEALQLAVMCTVDQLPRRPLMWQVVNKLKEIQPHSSS